MMLGTPPFNGTVLLKEWMKHIDGKDYIGVSGVLEVVKDSKLLGFDGNGRDANWAAVITSKGSRITIFGCQIRAITAHAVCFVDRQFLDLQNKDADEGMP